MKIFEIHSLDAARVKLGVFSDDTATLSLTFHAFMGGDCLEIYVDADACPVKSEVARVAERHGLVVHMVSNSWMRLPEGLMIKRVVVSEGFEKHGTASILDHPGYFPQGLVKIQVMQDALAKDDVEVFIRKRHVLGIHDLASQALAQFLLLSFLRRDLDSGRRNVDGIHEQAPASQFKAVTAATAAVFQRMIARRIL